MPSCWSWNSASHCRRCGRHSHRRERDRRERDRRERDWRERDQAGRGPAGDRDGLGRGRPALGVASVLPPGSPRRATFDFAGGGVARGRGVAVVCGRGHAAGGAWRAARPRAGLSSVAFGAALARSRVRRRCRAGEFDRRRRRASTVVARAPCPGHRPRARAGSGRRAPATFHHPDRWTRNAKSSPWGRARRSGADGRRPRSRPAVRARARRVGVCRANPAHPVARRRVRMSPSACHNFAAVPPSTSWRSR